jgi:hypothetical protein
MPERVEGSPWGSGTDPERAGFCYWLFFIPNFLTSYHFIECEYHDAGYMRLMTKKARLLLGDFIFDITSGSSCMTLRSKFRNLYAPFIT